MGVAKVATPLSLDDVALNMRIWGLEAVTATSCEGPVHKHLKTTTVQLCLSSYHIYVKLIEAHASILPKANMSLIKNWDK